MHRIPEETVERHSLRALQQSSNLKGSLDLRREQKIRDFVREEGCDPDSDNSHADTRAGDNACESSAVGLAHRVKDDEDVSRHQHRDPLQWKQQRQQDSCDPVQFRPLRRRKRNSRHYQQGRYPFNLQGRVVGGGEQHRGEHHKDHRGRQSRALRCQDPPDPRGRDKGHQQGSETKAQLHRGLEKRLVPERDQVRVELVYAVVQNAIADRLQLPGAVNVFRERSVIVRLCCRRKEDGDVAGERGCDKRDEKEQDENSSRDSARASSSVPLSGRDWGSLLRPEFHRHSVPPANPSLSRESARYRTVVKFAQKQSNKTRPRCTPACTDNTPNLVVREPCHARFVTSSAAMLTFSFQRNETSRRPLLQICERRLGHPARPTRQDRQRLPDAVARAGGP